MEIIKIENSQNSLEVLLQELKEKIQESGNKHLLGVIDNDAYLKTFIVGRKYRVDHAFETAKNHMNARYGKFQHIYSMPAKSILPILEAGLFGALKHRDHEGRLIGYLRVSKLDIKTMEFPEIMRAATFFAEHFWYDTAAIENGQVFIIDYEGYSFTIFRRYSFSDKLSFVTLFLNNYPSKIKEAHVYNNPYLVGLTYNFVKPFLPEKLKKRIFLHEYKKENVAKHFSPDILPIWMGGNLEDKDALDHTIVEKLKEMED